MAPLGEASQVDAKIMERDVSHLPAQNAMDMAYDMALAALDEAVEFGPTLAGVMALLSSATFGRSTKA